MLITSFIPSRLIVYRLRIRVRYWQVLAILTPYYVRQYLRREYRRDLAAIGYAYPHIDEKKRRREALFDGMYNMLLDSFTDVTGVKTRPETGQMMYFLIELSRFLDELLDDNISSEQALPSVSDALANPVVSKQMQLFRDFTTHYGNCQEIMHYLQEQFDVIFDNYLRILNDTRATRSFDTLFEAARIDTGVWMQAVMTIVGIFNQHTLTPEESSEFYEFGVAGKFADDMVDIIRDVRRDRTNLLFTLLHDTPGELQNFQAAVAVGTRLNSPWWVQNCPITITKYLKTAENHYSLIRSRKLRTTCDLVFLPAMLGSDHDPQR
jgi:hypothetical protein